MTVDKGAAVPVVSTVTLRPIAAGRWIFTISQKSAGRSIFTIGRKSELSGKASSSMDLALHI